MNSRVVSSSSNNLFLDSAEHLALRLEQESSPEAKALAQEARALTALFYEWQTTRPADDVRLAVIQQLFELNRRAMDFLAQ